EAALEPFQPAADVLVARQVACQRLALDLRLDGGILAVALAVALAGHLAPLFPAVGINERIGVGGGHAGRDLCHSSVSNATGRAPRRGARGASVRRWVGA